MSDDSREHRAPSETPECPVDRPVQLWIESSMQFFVTEFGTDILRADVILPAANRLSAGYSGTPEEIEALVTEICGLMRVDRRLITLEFFDGSAQKKEAAARGRRRTVGHFHMENGRAVIALDQSESADRDVLTAIVAHELCHVRLLGEGRLSPQRSDGERLTDLLVVYFGFGIFATNAAMRFTRRSRGWSVVPQGAFDDRTLNAAARHQPYNRLGYLRSREFGYALACYCWLRRETDPRWASDVDPGPRTYLREGLAWIARNNAIGELPTQRIIRSAANRNITIRVNPAGAAARGSFGAGPSRLLPGVPHDPATGTDR